MDETRERAAEMMRRHGPKILSLEGYDPNKPWFALVLSGTRIEEPASFSGILYPTYEEALATAERGGQLRSLNFWIVELVPRAQGTYGELKMVKL